MNPRLLVKLSVIALMLSPVCASAQIWWYYEPLPDLAPVNIALDGDCRIYVTLTNSGPGIMPSSAYVGPATGIQMYTDGSPWGGIALGALDPSHLTQAAGGTVTYAWFPGLTLPVGTHNVTLEVDKDHQVSENNEANNVMTRTLTCTPPAPDIIPVSLTVNSQCQLVVTLMNIGTAPIPDANFDQTGPNSVSIQMYNDGQPFGGISLGAFDLNRQLQPVGGTVTYTWFPSLKINGGPHTVSVVADNYNSVAELNEGNNTLTRSLSCWRIIWSPIGGGII
jgi:hypothetical protein